jgi:hypothetical protein
MFEFSTISKMGSTYLKKWRIFGYLGKSYSIETGETGKEVKSSLPIALRIHQFFQKDEDNAPHNHPWKWALSFIFWGGYDEIVTADGINWITRTRKAPSFNYISHGSYHRITKIYGKTFTLFLSGPKTSSWGFLVNGRHMEWKTFLGIDK